MKRKVGDKVKIKSVDWFKKNKNCSIDGDKVDFGELYYFSEDMLPYCGMIGTIIDSKDSKRLSTKSYKLDIDQGDYGWCDFMFEDDIVDNHEDYNNCSKKANLTLVSFGDLYIAVDLNTKTAIPMFFENSEEFDKYIKEGT